MECNRWWERRNGKEIDGTIIVFNRWWEGIEYWTCKNSFGEEWEEMVICKWKRNVPKQFCLSLQPNFNQFEGIIFLTK